MCLQYLEEIFRECEIVWLLNYALEWSDSWLESFKLIELLLSRIFGLPQFETKDFCECGRCWREMAYNGEASGVPKAIAAT